jgi:hypothetical protein
MGALLERLPMRKKMFAILLLILSIPTYGQDTSSHEQFQSALSATAAPHPPGGYLTVNGTRLWYESEGVGQALVLIPAGPGVPHNYFHP